MQSEVAEPIHCHIIAYRLLIHYFTLWPWPLTLNICSVSPVMWRNPVLNMKAIKQFAVKLLRYQCSTLWPWTLRNVLRLALG